MNTLNVAIIGAGMIGDIHIQTIRSDGRAHVSWIAARTQETLERKMAYHAISEGTLDYREILDDTSVDAVVIVEKPAMSVDVAAKNLWIIFRIYGVSVPRIAGAI